MPTVKYSALFEHIEARLRPGEALWHEPALRPILVARRLIEGDIFETPEEVVLSRVRASVCDYFYSEVEQFGWLRVPLPDEVALTKWIGPYLWDARLFGKRLLRRKDVPSLANLFASEVRKMWPVVAYFVLELLTGDVIAEVGAPSLVYALGIEWLGKHTDAFPRLVKVAPSESDVYTRLWQEAAILLAVQSPSEKVERILRTKVRRFTRESVAGGPGLMAAAGSLIRTRKPTAVPFEAIAYVNAVLRNAAHAESIQLRSATHLPRSTLQRYRRQGLDVKATEAELPSYVRFNQLRRQHRAEGSLTKRELASTLTTYLGFKVSLRAVGNAIVAVEAQLGTSAPREGSALRLDLQWCGLIKEYVIKSNSTKRSSGR